MYIPFPCNQWPTAANDNDPPFEPPSINPALRTILCSDGIDAVVLHDAAPGQPFCDTVMTNTGRLSDLLSGFEIDQQARSCLLGLDSLHHFSASRNWDALVPLLHIPLLMQPKVRDCIKNARRLAVTTLDTQRCAVIASIQALGFDAPTAACPHATGTVAIDRHRFTTSLFIRDDSPLLVTSANDVA